MVGFTLNKHAVHRWIMAQADRGAITRQCINMTENSTNTRYMYLQCKWPNLVFQSHGHKLYLEVNIFQFLTIYRVRKDMDATQIKHHELEVSNVLEIITAMSNPFDVEENMVNIANGKVPGEDVSEDDTCKGNRRTEMYGFHVRTLIK